MWHHLTTVFLSLALAITHADVEIEPWHLREHAGENDKPLVISMPGTEEALREKKKRVGDGSLFGRSYEHVSEAEEDREERKRVDDGSLFGKSYDDVSKSLPAPLRSSESAQRKKEKFLKRRTKFGAKRRPSKFSPSNPPPITVAVYYYPWYDTDFHGGKYIRGELNPPQYPMLGEYSDRDPAVIKQHLEWSREANVDLWVSSWWGPGSGTDTTIKDVIINHPDMKEMKFCLFYEAMGRIDVDTLNTRKVYSDILYAAKTYFADGNYYKINNRPVVFIYLTRVLAKQGILEDVIAMMRTAAFEQGHLLYIVGDHAFGSAPTTPLDEFDWFDCITNYDIFGSMDRPNGFAKMERVQAYAAEQLAWRNAANAQGCAYIPGATPGYNDKAVRPGNYTAMSRKLDKELESGTLFKALLVEAKKLVDGFADNILVVNSFNEWHEDTQIEPVVVGGATTEPWYLTQGYVYEGYGEKYLNILREATS